jgi:ABC-2 type transport system permease protein
MIRQIGFELYKMAKRPRSYTGFAAFLVFNVIILLAAKYGGLSSQAAGQAAGGGLQMTGSPMNAEFMAWFVVGSQEFAGGMVVFWMPLFVSLVLGEIFAGENAEGTIRALLARPVTRNSVFMAKFTASLIYVSALVVFLAASAYALGAAFFGTGGLLTYGMSGKLVWYSQGEALARLALACGLTCVVALTIGMVALFISVWLSNSLGAVAGAFMLLFATAIMSAIPYFEHIKPYLFGAHVGVGTKAFVDPIPWREIGASALCLGVYIVVLLVGSLMIFRRKDVLA